MDVFLIAEERVLPDISDHKYSIHIAGTAKEVEEAMKLRYEIFYKELNREFGSDESIDRDKYDDQCHHLIVKVNETSEIVGTYRLQTYELASKGIGFYSGSLFNLTEFDDSILKKGFEVGRACIDKDHRNGRVLYLLWKGFAGYLQHFEKRYLFGSFGIDAENSSEGLQIYQKIKDNDLLHETYRLSPKDKYSINSSGEQAKSDIDFEIPALLQNYVSVGCKICSQPAYHPDLKVLYAMVLLDIEEITPKIRKMFFG